ncbi:MAG: diguanylate cyclase [Deltaproteobacteria bacterium]|nr:MAG: diguanylate cyclase [Deltaproteobacteria bacterium]
MEYKDLHYFLQNVGKDPSQLIFEDELTGIYNRRFLLNFFQYKVAWDSLESQPVSLLMMDVDHFKKINDTHGHEVGDQTLIWIANLIREVSDNDGLPIRYAGDEFMILLPRVGKEKALQTGEQLLQRLREESLQPSGIDGDLHITLSIGVASAPDEAENGKALIQKADTALYYAKKSGRNQLANAGAVAPQEVFSKTALHQLDSATIVGRGTQLARVAKALRKLSQRQCQFLIVEGAAGMGKSEFLEAIRRNIARTKIKQIVVSGMPQEGFRPYYLTTNILVELLNQRRDKGAAILDSLTAREVNYLSHILPQLGEPEHLDDDEDEKDLREGIFTTLVHIIPRLVDSRPLILLVDDLYFSDEATLIVMRQLLIRKDMPLLICGTTSDIQPDRAQGQQSPLERFFADYHQELEIDKLTLTPLGPEDIARQLHTLFPQVGLPEGFEEVLAQVTHGNPLFVSEILGKLVQDGKIALVGQQWIIEPLEEGYLPRSLEEIISQKIAALDQESRQLLDQASAFGENVSLSTLTGSFENRETKVLEFVDQAVAQGLVTSDFQMNDDTIRFLGKRVLDITYGAIQEEQKQELHERIGAYQETLYSQRLLPSAATLAYHFQRSANQVKAQLYQESFQAHNKKIFNAQEAKQYTGEKVEDGAPEDSPLDADSLSMIPDVIRMLLTTVRNIKLYPPGSNAIVTTTGQLREAVDKVLANNERLNIIHSEDALMVNGEPLDVSEFKSIADAFTKFLSRMDLRGVAFSKGLNERELKVMLEALGRISRKMIDRGFWKRFVAEQRLVHVEMKQIRYTKMAEQDDAPGDQENLQGDGWPAPAGDPSTRVVAGEQALDEHDLDQIPKVIRCLLTAASNIKLYPPESKAITLSIDELRLALQDILDKRPALTLARVGEALLVNGEKIDTTDFKTLADGFLNLLGTFALSSLSFLQQVSPEELKTFVAVLGQLPVDRLDSRTWQSVARERKLSGILFNQRLYGILQEQPGIGSGQPKSIEDLVAETDRETREPLPSVEADLASQVAVELEMETSPEEPQFEERVADVSEASLDAMAEQLTDHLLKGEEKQFREKINQLFHEFADQTPQIRAKVILVCRTLLEDLGPVPRLQSLDLLTDPVLIVFKKEEDPQLLGEMGALLSKATANLIQLGDYQRATRILTYLRKRQRQMEDSQDGRALPRGLVFLEALDSETQRMLLEDLKSREPDRQQQAAQLLGSLGTVAVPLLIEVIKQEDDLRLRQVASRLLAGLGPEAAKLLKRELVLEGLAEERVRILEVIDSVTSDLKTELAYALADQAPQVRRAAFRLAERMDDEQISSLLLDYAKHENSSMAVVAIKSLGKLKPEGATGVLVSLLESAKDTERVIACSRALGQIGDPAAIEPLAKIMSPGSFLSFRKKRSSLVRATAAFALAQIRHPQVVEVFAPYVEDRDPRVRQVAQGFVRNSKSSSRAGND